MTPTILSVLDQVKKSGSSTWTCQCPAHDDRTPSLRVTQLDDGRMLIHCFAGCGAAEVLSAVGMSMTDLFPDSGPLSDHFRGWHPQMRDRNKQEADRIMLELSAARRARGQRQSPRDRRAEFEAWRRQKQSAKM